MFEKLQQLCASLSDGDFTNWRNASQTRKVLQQVKLEAQRLRGEILAQRKSPKA